MVHLFLEVFTSWDTKDTIRSAKKWSERNCRHNSLCVLPSFFCEERENRKKTRAYLPIVSNFFFVLRGFVCMARYTTKTWACFVPYNNQGNMLKLLDVEGWICLKVCRLWLTIIYVCLQVLIFKNIWLSHFWVRQSQRRLMGIWV